MGRSQETYSKREKEKKRQRKREDKAKKRAEKKLRGSQGGLENMMAYIDENGVIVDTPPDPTKKKVFKAKDIQISVPKQEDIEMDPIRTGKVAFFNHDKGFGFIKDSETGEDYFVHVRGLIDEVEEHDRVVFELEPGMKGLNAVRVKKV